MIISLIKELEVIPGLSDADPIWDIFPSCCKPLSCVVTWPADASVMEFIATFALALLTALVLVKSMTKNMPMMTTVSPAMTPLKILM